MEIKQTPGVHAVDQWIRSLDSKAVIFDLDGTLIDNNSYHLKTWRIYLENIGIGISEEAYRANINGRTNKDALEYIYGKKMTDEEAMVYALEKEALYREIYAPHIRPVQGLLEFLEVLKTAGIPMAIATSGIQVNIDFMFEHIPIRQYFSTVVNSSHISQGKPHPEIYLKAAALLNIQPEDCLAVEDAAVGVRSARDAGMKTLAITTTQAAEELKDADMIVKDFSSGSLLNRIK